MTHKFVEYIPKTLEDNIIYISLEYGAITHKCCCGCGEKVFTPLSPTDWKLTYDGEAVSLYPSIGSWNLPCRSHYWIKNNQVVWAGSWTDEEIENGRKQNRTRKDKYYNHNNANHGESHQKEGLWFKIKKLFME